MHYANILMSICDLKNSSRNYDLKGEVGVMQHEFCYVEGTKWGDQKDISEYQISSNSNENYQTFCGT